MRSFARPREIDTFRDEIPKSVCGCNLSKKPQTGFGAEWRLRNATGEQRNSLLGATWCSMQKGAAMSMKLLVVGIALTFVALRSDSRLNAPPPTTRIPLAEPEVTTSATPPRRAYGKIGGRFEFLVAQSVSQSVANSEASLRALEPYVAAANGRTQMEANRIADEVASAIAKAKQEMSRGRTYRAMDHAMHASNRIDDLRKKVFERR